jgi:hypothetical protein
MDYLNFSQALTYRNAKAKKTTVNSNIVISCIAALTTPGVGLIDHILNKSVSKSPLASSLERCAKVWISAVHINTEYLTNFLNEA